MEHLKRNLNQAQTAMKVYSDKTRKQCEFKEGDQVLLKLHPYRQITVQKRTSQKLALRYYGPFAVLQRIGPVAYKLQLPPSSRIHPVFHVSLLRPFVSPTAFKVHDLPPHAQDNKPLHRAVAILGEREVWKKGKLVKEVLVQWTDGAPEDSSWEEDTVQASEEAEDIAHESGEEDSLAQDRGEDEELSQPRDDVPKTNDGQLPLPPAIMHASDTLPEKIMTPQDPHATLPRYTPQRVVDHMASSTRRAAIGRQSTEILIHEDMDISKGEGDVVVQPTRAHPTRMRASPRYLDEYLT